MDALDKDIIAYEKMREELEAKYMGKWVLVHDERLFGTYESFESVSEEAVREFGRGPFLIRQVGAPPITLPASVTFFPLDERN